MSLRAVLSPQPSGAALYATGPNTERILLALTQLCLSFKIYEWAWYGLWAADKGNSWSVAGENGGWMHIAHLSGNQRYARLSLDA